MPEKKITYNYELKEELFINKEPGQTINVWYFNTLDEAWESARLISEKSLKILARDFKASDSVIHESLMKNITVTHTDPDGDRWRHEFKISETAGHGRYAELKGCCVNFHDTENKCAKEEIIDAAQLTTRVRNFIKNKDIRTVNDLKKWVLENGLYSTNIGSTSRDEIISLIGDRPCISSLPENMVGKQISGITADLKVIRALAENGVHTVSDFAGLNFNDIMSFNVSLGTKDNIIRLLNTVVMPPPCGEDCIEDFPLSNTTKSILADCEVATVAELESLIWKQGFCQSGITAKGINEICVLIGESKPECSSDDGLAGISTDRIILDKRTKNTLALYNIKTAADITKLTLGQIAAMDTGIKTKDKIIHLESEICRTGMLPVHESKEKGFDYDLISFFSDGWGLTGTDLVKWAGLTKQRVSQILHTRPVGKYASWKTTRITAEEEDALVTMLDKGKLEYTFGCRDIMCLNNGKGGFAVIFADNGRIKCIFLHDLPQYLIKTIKGKKYDLMIRSDRNKNLNGKTVKIKNKDYFLPEDRKDFRNAAMQHGMHVKEFSEYLTGHPLIPNHYIPDEKIVRFFSDMERNGIVSIPAEPEYQWIRTYASRCGTTLSELASSYGYTYDERGMSVRQHMVDDSQRKILGRCPKKNGKILLRADSGEYRTLRSYCIHNGLTIDERLQQLGLQRYTKEDAARDAHKVKLNITPEEYLQNPDS